MRELLTHIPEKNYKINKMAFWKNLITKPKFFEGNPTEEIYLHLLQTERFPILNKYIS